MRTPGRLRERHSDLAAACGEAFHEMLTFFHGINFGGEAKHATIESVFLILQVVATAKRERAGQGAVRDRVARRGERELRAAVKLLTVGDDVQLAAEHIVVELKRLAGRCREKKRTAMFSCVPA